jgi:nucleoside-diphosphate-sugar epimerase
MSQSTDGYCVHGCDLLDERQQQKLFEKIRPTHLLHFAWDVTHGKFWTTENNLTWMQSSISLLKNFNQFGGERVVFAGTCAEYDWKYGYCVERVTPLMPNTLYGVCKNALNDIFQSYCSQENISAGWGRIFHLYGPNEIESRFVPTVICSMLRKERVRCSAGTQIRDFMYVEDVANGFVCLLDNKAVTGSVNIASGEPVSLKAVVELIADKSSYTDKVEFGALSIATNDPALLVGSNARLQSELFFTPKYSLEEGLGSSVKWWVDRLDISRV